MSNAAVEMASDNEASCESDPNFAVICAFLEKFGPQCGITNIDFLELQSMLENTQEVAPYLIDLHVKLMRKARKSVPADRWERVLVKICHTFSSQDAWEIERFGYKKARLLSKVRVLKELLEMQFDCNTKFKSEVNKQSAEVLRSQPLGRDKLGHAYWFQSDENYQIRVYKEDLDDETWRLVAKDREGLVSLINLLSDRDAKLSSDSAGNEDSNSLSEKPIIDTGQADSDSKKTTTPEDSEDSSELKKDEDEVQPNNKEESATKQVESVAKDEENSRTDEEKPSPDEEKIRPDEKPRPDDEKAKPVLRLKNLSELIGSPKRRRDEEEPQEKIQKIKIRNINHSPVISEAIEEPVITIQGEGLGEDNKSVYDEASPIIGDEIEEEVVYIIGRGEGVNCQTGNEKSSDEKCLNSSTNSISDKQNNFSDNNTKQVPSSHKLGIISDTKTGSITKSVVAVKKSRWDVEKSSSSPSVENEVSQETPTKNPIFFFGINTQSNSIPPTLTIGFGSPKKDSGLVNREHEKEEQIVLANSEGEEKCKVPFITESPDEQYVSNEECIENSVDKIEETSETSDSDNGAHEEMLKSDDGSKENSEEISEQLSGSNDTTSEELSDSVNTSKLTCIKDINTELGVPTALQGKEDKLIEEHIPEKQKSNIGNNEEETDLSIDAVETSMKNDISVKTLETNNKVKTKLAESKINEEKVLAQENGKGYDCINESLGNQGQQSTQEKNLIIPIVSKEQEEKTLNLATEENKKVKEEFLNPNTEGKQQDIKLPNIFQEGEEEKNESKENIHEKTVVEEAEDEKKESTNPNTEEGKAKDIKLPNIFQEVEEEKNESKENIHERTVMEEAGEKNESTIPNVVEKSKQIEKHPFDDIEFEKKTENVRNSVNSLPKDEVDKEEEIKNPVTEPMCIKKTAYICGENEGENNDVENLSSNKDDGNSLQKNQTVTAEIISQERKDIIKEPVLPIADETKEKDSVVKEPEPHTTIETKEKESHLKEPEPLTANEMKERESLKPAIEPRCLRRKSYICGESGKPLDSIKVTEITPNNASNKKNVQLKKTENQKELISHVKSRSTRSGKSIEPPNEFLDISKEETIICLEPRSTRSSRALESVSNPFLENQKQEPINRIEPRSTRSGKTVAIPSNKPLPKNRKVVPINRTEVRPPKSGKTVVRPNNPVVEQKLEGRNLRRRIDVSDLKINNVKDKAAEEKSKQEKLGKEILGKLARNPELRVIIATSSKTNLEIEKKKSNETCSLPAVELRPVGRRTRATKLKDDELLSLDVHTISKKPKVVIEKSENNVALLPAETTLHGKVTPVLGDRKPKGKFGGPAITNLPQSVVNMVISVPDTADNNSTNSSDVQEVIEKDPLAVSDEEEKKVEEKEQQLGLSKKPANLSTFSLDFNDSPIPSPIPIISSLRQLRKRGRDDTAQDSKTSERMPEKKLKIKGRRHIDAQLRKIIEQQKQQQASSSEKGSEDEKSNNKSPKKKVSMPKKEIIVEISDDDSTVDTPTSTPKQKNPLNRNKRILANLGISEDQPLENVGVRQSRRIAQIKIKEQYEVKKPEPKPAEERKKKKKSKEEDKNYKAEKRKRNIPEKQETPEKQEVIVEKKKKKKKEKSPSKLFNEHKPWQSSSDSSEDMAEEEEEDEEVIEEEEEPNLEFRSDHEFSPESDVEDNEFQPLKRARTARKETDVEEIEEFPCQKCGKSDHPEWILLCDKCDNGWHCSCLRPPLLVIPEGDWFCPPCQHNLLLDNLQAKLIEYDKKLCKKEIEDRRKERLAYVGISLNNVLPGKDAEHRKKKRPHSAECSEPSSKESSSESESESESDSDEPIYQLRQRRQAKSYKFNEFDEMIKSAIEEEEEAKQSAVVQSRGKDIATIVKGLEPEPKPPVVPKETDINEAEEIRPARPIRKLRRKKQRKLNNLDAHSEEEDDVSDEDFKGTSSEEEESEEVQESDDSDDYAGKRRRRNEGPLRRSTRARVRRYDSDFIDDDSDDEEEAPKRKKKRAVWYESDSDGSERVWGGRSKRSIRLIPKKKKKKKRKGRLDDSDLENFEKKKRKPRIKYGGLESSEEDVGRGRRTRGKKTTYVDTLGSDSEEETRKKNPRRIESDDEDFVANEEDEVDEEDRDSEDNQEQVPEEVVREERRPLVVPKIYIKKPSGIRKLPEIEEKFNRELKGFKEKAKEEETKENVHKEKDDLLKPMSPKPQTTEENKKEVNISEESGKEQKPVEVNENEEKLIEENGKGDKLPEEIGKEEKPPGENGKEEKLHEENAITQQHYNIEEKNKMSSIDDIDDESNPIAEINKNVEQMDVIAMQKMMEEEEYANQQLKMVAEKLLQEKKRRFHLQQQEQQRRLQQQQKQRQQLQQRQQEKQQQANQQEQCEREHQQQVMQQNQQEMQQEQQHEMQEQHLQERHHRLQETQLQQMQELQEQQPQERQQSHEKQQHMHDRQQQMQERLQQMQERQQQHHERQQQQLQQEKQLQLHYHHQQQQQQQRYHNSEPGEKIETVPPVKIPAKRGRKPKVVVHEPIVSNVSALIRNDIENDDLSEPPGFSLPLFEELASSSKMEETPKKRRGRGPGRAKKTLEETVAILGDRRPKDMSTRPSTDNPNIEIATPPQPFSQSQPTPSVITRMLQSKPGQTRTYPVGTIRPKQFATMPDDDAEEPVQPNRSRGSSPAASVPLGGPSTQYMQGGHRGSPGGSYRPIPPGMNHYPRSMPQAHQIRGPPPTNNMPAHMYSHPHRPLDPSPSGGGPINMSNNPNPPTVVPLPESNSPGGSRICRYPPISSAPNVTITNTRPQMHMMPPRPNLAPYVPNGPPPAGYYGSYPSPTMTSNEDAMPPTAYQNSPYSDQYGDAGSNPSDNSNSKPYEEESGGEFGGLVSYFSSQREDDLES